MFQNPSNMGALISRFKDLHPLGSILNRVTQRLDLIPQLIGERPLLVLTGFAPCIGQSPDFLGQCFRTVHT